MMIKLVGLAVMVAGLYEFLGLFTITRDLELVDAAQNLKDFGAWGSLTKEQKDVLVRICLKVPCEVFEIGALLVGALLLPVPLKWALLAVAIILPGVAHLMRKILPRPLYVVWSFLDHVVCTAVMVGGPVYFLR